MGAGLVLDAVRADGMARSVSLAVPVGGIAGVVLPDSATLCRFSDAVIGTGDGWTGLVTVGGRPRARPDTASLDGAQPLIGLVTADGGLLPHLSLRENIVFGRLSAGGGASPRLADEADKAAERAGLLMSLDRHPHRATPGQRQQAGFARVLFRRRPAVVVEDRTGFPRWAGRLDAAAARTGVALLVVTDDRRRLDGFVPAADVVDLTLPEGVSSSTVPPDPG
ncbi:MULTISPECIES: hypothetical protein [Actinoalloteichus]|uniref:ABC transporter ATP-binding protein n=1 Tax=Actinoalloteichus fjordicus TaxID=1612552 RepID=A0AAC9PR40_9PSEU|nr:MULTISPECIES: hypothetical protein [Actinoalloteichus]APU13703.1 hypothetical protein UA74_08185 [Actinoalloteichus fjordicus]APU19649.1 hypothetical protein UA75_08165 [Actinoalloteichus sp. GBA129-24]